MARGTTITVWCMRARWSNLQNNRLPVTAYIVWSLIDAGFGNDARTQKGLAYVREHRGEAEDAYVRGAGRERARRRRSRREPMTRLQLDPRRKKCSIGWRRWPMKTGHAVTWPSNIATFMGSTGPDGQHRNDGAGDAGLAARQRSSATLRTAALTGVGAEQKDASGTWYTTQATILALKALLQSVRAGSENVNADDHDQTRRRRRRARVKVTRENFDVVQAVTFNDLAAGRDHTIEIARERRRQLDVSNRGQLLSAVERRAAHRAKTTEPCRHRREVRSDAAAA